MKKKGETTMLWEKISNHLQFDNGDEFGHEENDQLLSEVKELLEKKIALPDEKRKNEPVIFWAIHMNSLRLTKILVENGCDLNVTDGRCLPVEYAIFRLGNFFPKYSVELAKFLWKKLDEKEKNSIRLKLEKNSKNFNYFDKVKQIWTTV